MISDTLQLPAAHTMISQDQVNSIDPLENQLCRVCDEKAAGFHFGAFTCEGCKSFFGRFCNNQTVIPDCKNNYMCVIDKRNRTSCKACRLKKCLSVGMSKSGCRYGRRSNWFKIHCLMQKNAQKPTSQPIVAPVPRQTLTIPRPILAPAPVYSSPTKPLLSSRSPSPLNTSLESSSTQSSPSPNSDISRRIAGSSDSSPTQLPQLPAYLSHLAGNNPSVTSPLSLPLFDPLSLYRLSPLLALSTHLAQVQAQQAQQQQQQTQQLPSPPVLGMDFKQTLDLLAERRALFEKLKSEAMCSSPSSETNESTESVPVDLSVK